MKKIKFLLIFSLGILVYSCMCTQMVTYSLTSDQKDYRLDSVGRSFSMKDLNGISDAYTCHSTNDTTMTTIFDQCGPISANTEFTNIFSSSVNNFWIDIVFRAQPNDYILEVREGDALTLIYSIQRKMVDQCRINYTKDIKAEVSYSESETVNGKVYHGNYTIQLNNADPNLAADGISMLMFSKHFGIVKLQTKSGETWLRQNK